MSTLDKKIYQAFSLTIGQSAYYTLEQGSMIVVQGGAIELVTLIYVAQSMVLQAAKIENGQSHLLQTTGVYQMRANGTTTILLIPCDSKSKRGWKRMISWVAAFKISQAFCLKSFKQ